MGSVLSSPKMPADDEKTMRADAAGARRLEHVERADDVDLPSPSRVVDRARVADAGRQVEDHVAALLAAADRLGVAHVALDELRRRARRFSR